MRSVDIDPLSTFHGWCWDIVVCSSNNVHSYDKTIFHQKDFVKLIAKSSFFKVIILPSFPSLHPPGNVDKLILNSFDQSVGMYLT
jgi:hypothetical protein